MRDPIIIVIGTRPEGIKMAPVYHALKRAGIPVILCCTFQHTDLLRDVLALFKITPDIALNVMRTGQDLFYVTQAVLQEMRTILARVKPSLVMVHGDTTTAFATALAAFYSKIPVAHVEAGVRSGSISAPFPEEMNRSFISLIARYNFAPTEHCARNLRAIGVANEAIAVIGNTVVDALRWIQQAIATGDLVLAPALRYWLEKQKNNGHKIVLLTMHRRESFGIGIARILGSVSSYARAHPHVYFLFPVHPNPQVRQAVERSGIAQEPNVWVTDPLLYHDLVHTLSQVDCVATDSGGIQEEAASLGIPALVLREQTDRPEALDAGLACMSGYETSAITKGLDQLLAKCPLSSTSVYGDGTAASRIAEILMSDFCNQWYRYNGPRVSGVTTEQ